MKSGVRVRNLTKIYHPSPRWMRLLVRSNLKNDVVALDNVSFEVGPGEICAVVGPNGAGKSTTFRILVGLTTMSTGEASILGHDCLNESIAVRRLVGWMPAEDRSLLMRLSCFDNLFFHGRLQGLGGEDLRGRIHNMLAQVELGHAADNSVFSLSAGQRARLQLARALLHEPKVLILDEPTGSVDPVGSHELLNLIISVVEEQRIAAVISSHRLEEIEALHSHVILLDRGQLRYYGDLDEFRARWDTSSLEIKYSSVTAAEQSAARIELVGLGHVLRQESGTVQCIPSSNVTVGDMLNGLSDFSDALLNVREMHTPLRDLLADMYRRGRDEDAS